MPTQHYLSDHAVAARYGIHRITVWRWAASGLIPQPVKLSPGTTRWRLADLERIEAERTPGGQAA